jgi:hypothetical protein
VYSEPIILPFDIYGEIYAIQDETGNIVGTGSRDVCAVLVHMMRKQTSKVISTGPHIESSQRNNVRAAIVI